jgi:membrane-bound lytic murein transglycosylase D
MITAIYRKASLLTALSVCVFLGADPGYAAGPTKQTGMSSPRYSLPASLSGNSFRFADEIIPLRRPDVRSRIQFQVNFLLLDARSVVTLWLSEESRQAWILEEVFEKERIPREFVWLAPIMARMKRSGDSRHKGGLWALKEPCPKVSVLGMYSGKSYDDRLDVELATKCFAVQLKKIRKNLGTRSWLMAAAAYMTSEKTIDGLMKQWNTKSFWNIPFDDNPELLIPRWIALAIIGSHGKTYGLNFKRPPPMTFDQVTGLVLTKDLPVAEIARMTGVPPRVILQLNPKISPSAGLFPAKVKGKRHAHTIAAPRGKGWILVKKLKKGGFLVPTKKR